MISALFIINSEGDVLVSRIFREDVKYGINEIFFNKIIKFKENNKLVNPILTIGSTSFLYLEQNDIYYVVITRHNSDTSIILQYLNDFFTLLNELLIDYDNNNNANNKIISDFNIMDNVLLIYELLDLTIDQGYIKEIDINRIQDLIVSPIIKISESEIKQSEYKLLQSDKKLSIIFKTDLSKFSSDSIEIRNTEFLKVNKDKVYLTGEVISTCTSQLPIHIESQLCIPNNINTLIIPSNQSIPIKMGSNKTKMQTSIDQPNQSLLNYAQENIFYDDLPVIINGSYDQVSKDKFEINVIIKYKNNYEIKDLVVKVPVPENTLSIIDVEDHTIKYIDNSKSEGYLQWELSELDDKNSCNSNNQIYINKIIQVDSSSKLSKWLVDRGITILTYTLHNVTITEFNVQLFNSIDNEKNKEIHKTIKTQTIADYEVNI